MTARRWAPIVFGIAVFVVLGLAVFGVSWVRDHLTIESTSAATAESAFDEGVGGTPPRSRCSRWKGMLWVN
jgi:hypothetical protein